MSYTPQTRAELQRLIVKLEELVAVERAHVATLPDGDHMRAVHERTLANLESQLDACRDRMDELPN